MFTLSKKFAIICAMVLTIFVLFVGIWSAPVYALINLSDDSNSDATDTAYVTVAVDNTTITVAGQIQPAINADGIVLRLYELACYEDETSFSSMTPVAAQELGGVERNFSFTISRYDDQRDRYYSKYLVTMEGTASDSGEEAVFPAQYVTDINFESKYAYAYPSANTKKGLLVEMTDDAEELGIGHAVVNVELSTMMFEENLDPSNTLIYNMDGQDFYFNKSKFEELDKKIKTLSDNGVIVNLIIIIYPNFLDNYMAGALCHPNAVMGAGGGTVMAFNTVEEEGVQAFRAVMEFITDRYTREDQMYGRAVGYIIGNEVDAQWEWQNMGYATLSEFIEQYEPALRIAYLAAQKHYSEARIYTSLTNHWSEAYDTDPQKGYPGRDVIDQLNQQSKLNGDFPWNIAYHPYPEDFFNSDTWDDALAVDSVNASVVTFKNIHILHDYIGQDYLKCDSVRRRIILSEQGFHTADSSVTEQQKQAAAYAYAYYKSAFLDGIDAFILFSHIDIPSYGLNMGLWTQDSSTTTPMTPDEQKYIYDVFKYIDTDTSLEVTEFAKSIIGITDWSSIVSGFDENLLPVRDTPSTIPLMQVSAIQASTGDNYNDDICEWTASDNTMDVSHSNIESYFGEGSLEADFSALALKWRGVEKKFSINYDASATPYLRFAVKLTNTNTELPYYIKVKVYSGQNVAEAVSTLNPTTEWNVFSLDMTEWSGISSIDRIKIWVKSEGTSTWEGKLYVDEVSFTCTPLISMNENGTHAFASNEHILFNFEGTTQNWTAGENTNSVSSVTTMANLPFTPLLGDYMLEASFPTAVADTWRTVIYIPDNVLDLSKADALVYGINCYGGSGGTGYETRIRIHSNTHILEETVEIDCDTWNQVSLDLTGWEYRNSITKIEVALRAVGSTATWYGSRFQLDSVRYVAHDDLENEMDMIAQSLEPFWQGTTMYNETVLMVSNDGNLPEANLLFSPNAILSVRSARLDIEYLENIDWVLEDGKLKLTPTSRIPYLTESDLYYATYTEGTTMPMKTGGAVIYREGSYFHDRQIVITYTHDENLWEGPVPVLADQALTRTLQALKNGEPLRIVLYGDSISVGANSSGYTNAAPHLPIWGQLVANELASYYGSHITFINPSVGGKTSEWGKEQATNLVANEHPDLVIIAFGMNDGSGTGANDGIAPAVFRSNILSIINDVRLVNPDAEFILVGTTLPNEETIFFDQQPNYLAELNALASLMDGVAVANMTGVHTELLEHKAFLDMTGNNINHPNDFLARWYAQYILGMLKDPSVFASTSAERMLYSFEDSTQDWIAGDNVISVANVSSFANYPFGPAQGNGALEAQFPDLPADAWRTIQITPLYSIDLTNADCFVYKINGYGGSGGSGYETRLRLYSNEEMMEYTTAISADNWNLISADISDWQYRGDITTIEISFRATGTSALWYGSRFQIDAVGYQIKHITLFDFEGSCNGWVADDNVHAVSSVDGFANYPFAPISNAYALEAVFATAPADLWHTVSYSVPEGLDLSVATHFYYSINSYGGSGGSGYETRLRLYSGTEMLEYTVVMNADNWNFVEVNIDNWTYKSNITKIEISFHATGCSTEWPGSRFQIDNIGYKVE